MTARNRTVSCLIRNISGSIRFNTHRHENNSLESHNSPFPKDHGRVTYFSGFICGTHDIEEQLVSTAWICKATFPPVATNQWQNRYTTDWHHPE